jgi:hypothetical protein
MCPRGTWSRHSSTGRSGSSGLRSSGLGMTPPGWCNQCLRAAHEAIVAGRRQLGSSPICTHFAASSSSRSASPFGGQSSLSHTRRRVVRCFDTMCRSPQEGMMGAPSERAAHGQGGHEREDGPLSDARSDDGPENTNRAPARIACRTPDWIRAGRHDGARYVQRTASAASEPSKVSVLQ